MVSGIISSFKKITLEEDITALLPEDKALESYVRQKHKTAEENNRYVVKFFVADPTDESPPTVVYAFIPKVIIDGGLIESGIDINCNSTACHLKVFDVDDWFDRASNGATQIHDTRFKSRNDRNDNPSNFDDDWGYHTPCCPIS